MAAQLARGLLLTFKGSGDQGEDSYLQQYSRVVMVSSSSHTVWYARTFQRYDMSSGRRQSLHRCGASGKKFGFFIF